MPKYYDFKICGYYLYFTSHCVIESMHVHASDSRLTEGGSAKLFVRSNRGIVSERDMRCIQAFIKDNYQEMYLKWSLLSDQGYLGEK